jgi:hypothetical protein
VKTIELILLVLGAFCFFLSTGIFSGVPDRINLLALGLLFWILVPLITLAQS